MSLLFSTQECLDFYKQKDGPTLTAVFTAITNSKYKYLPLNDKETLCMQFQNSATAYLSNINTNLQQRFEPESLGHLETLNKLLNPAHMSAENRAFFLSKQNKDQKLRSRLQPETVTKTNKTESATRWATPIRFQPGFLHLPSSLTKKTEENETKHHTAVIPVGILQATDVNINKPITVALEQKWNAWISGDNNSFTNTGRMCKPELPIICSWIVEAWKELDP
ncbi:unnamed protein product [Mytilus coruscus]|uniref:Uncharacterized protein n=1 Tax=Mytilus coruscus TaxID=42192 RepID=A0A6J8BEU6_MYTCO|nr:unnamed protein product [Mytilus coruscus]